MRIDLHCHSRHSKRPALWLMQKLGCPESFTDPLELYDLARRQGMHGVTITDHNVIDGALEIAHLPGAFVSCEYTTYFPQDRCKAHVLAYNITEAQHRDLSQARESIFDLAAYLREQDIPHACAHPLFWVNDRLTFDHVEMVLLLFRNLELNGDLNPEMNDATRRLVQGLTPELMARLADKHDIAPAWTDPWKKNLVGGSDDHSSLNIARTYTEVANADTIAGFFSGIHEGHATVQCGQARPQTLARGVYGIAYQFYKDRFGLERHVNKDVFLRFLDRCLQTRPEVVADPWLTRLALLLPGRYRRAGQAAREGAILGLARVEAEKLIREDPQLMAIVRDARERGTDMDRTWFEFVNQVSNKVLAQFGQHLVDRVGHARLFDLFHSAGSAGALYTLLAPYFVAFSVFTKQRRWSRRVLDRLGAGAPGNGTVDRARVAHFTDTLHDVNGVARTLQQQLESAIAMNKDYTIVTCSPPDTPCQRGVHQFSPIGSCSLPEYPELDLLVPPLLQMLNLCFDEGFTHIHLATPGPVGLAGLGIARILQLPVAGTYHTAFPQYVKAFTDDSYVEDMAWRAMVWFYNQLDTVYVPSHATGNELAERGIAADKVRVYPRGVDIERFHPRHKSRILDTRFGIEPGRLTFLYVGRVSREKNLHVLAEAFRALAADRQDLCLVVTGDGPYRAQMERELSGTPTIFTGYLEGDELAAVYASSSVLLFPSTTDTFGNVVLEAQASGIPVVVSDQGGPRENLVPEQTGFVVRGNDADALCDVMRVFLDEPCRAARMGAAARAYMENRGFDQAFAQLYDMFVQESHEARDMEGVFASLFNDPSTAIAP